MSLVSYADDPVSLKAFVESDLTKILEWLHFHSLFPNENKTKYMLFHNRKNHENFTIQSLNISFNGHTLERVESMRVLGLEVDERLLYNVHINHLLHKLAPFIYALKRIRKYLTDKTAISMYFAYVESRIAYMSAIWSAAPKYLLDSIDILQRKALRIVFDKDSRCNNKELYSEKILPASKAGEMHTLLLLFKMLNNLATKNHIFFTRDQIHMHRTRNSSNLVIPQANTQFGQKNFFYRAPQIFNNLPNEIKNLTAVSLFKNRIKEYLYQQLE